MPGHRAPASDGKHSELSGIRNISEKFLPENRQNIFSRTQNAPKMRKQPYIFRPVNVLGPLGVRQHLSANGAVPSGTACRGWAGQRLFEAFARVGSRSDSAEKTLPRPRPFTKNVIPLAHNLTYDTLGLDTKLKHYNMRNIFSHAKNIC